MGGAVLYPHSFLHLPSVSTSIKPRFGKSFVSLKETADRPFVSSIRADGNRGRHQKKLRADGPDDNFQSFDGRSSLSPNMMSPNKEEILALFKRIQASISKGGTKKKFSKLPKDKSLTESILEDLRQARERGKGREGDIYLAPRKDSSKKEEKASHSSTSSFKSSRPPSKFTRRSPIPTLSSPRDDDQPKNETLQPITPQLLTPRDEVEPQHETVAARDEDDDQQSKRFEEMKLAQLKEVAKSKGIRGYSKLKKSELVDLLIRSPNEASP